MSALKETPLSGWHAEHGAKMVDFAGWKMPVQYEGIIKEHEQTRTAAAVFDICHMGEFLLKGPGARDALDRIVTHNLLTLGAGKCRYGFMLNERGGVLDDLIVYCLGEDDYMLVVNGACEESDFSWCAGHLPHGLTFTNVSAETAKIDLQGPRSLDALEKALGSSWGHLKYFNFERSTFDGAPLIVSRTGYTGELGYELYLPWNKALAMWELLLGVDYVKPAGLGARDTLRLEMGYPLYGQDLDTEHTPVEAGYGFLMGKEGPFVGKEALGEVRGKLVPLEIEGRRSARHGDAVLGPGGKPCGVVTSGAFSPTLGHCLALAYVDAAQAERATFTIKGQRVDLPAKRSELPFFKEGTARMKTA
ncbi:glycine cleavage system T protein [Desulfovibrio sp. X2]|uniref:glycine cleavage system aminomethyltransferase GcvT n=1 Tax=Desulfovibrio sp. X2 TaxID=941449 RepID=UPI000358B10A|nr:glycine cleavage system aminomethyltransferase GcvT [Desulfovibrio sp. X2]EPR42311.1 glycine cleavage system T protein [Desulfovibrio sp. X2]